MIKRVYYVICDNCGISVHSYFYATKEKAESEAKASGFVIYGGKHYCIRCSVKLNLGKTTNK